jgi:hypothetical protein
MKHTELTLEIASLSSTKQRRIINPHTEGYIYGCIPPNSIIEAGNIFLCLGYVGHSRKKLGAFGARHIWDKHKRDLGLSIFSEVPSAVAALLVEGSDVLVDYSKGGEDKPIVVNTSSGMVSLQARIINSVVEYHVITAYDRKNHPGTVVAQIKKPE